MKIAFRVDGSKKLGMGHVIRCKIISENLKNNNISSIFLTQFRQIYDYLSLEGFDVFFIRKRNESKQVNYILKNEHCSKLVIDSKRKSIKKIIEHIDKKIKIIVIDNQYYSNNVDLTVISSIKNPKKQYPQNSIVGIKYILHGIKKPQKNILQKKNSILISMGGSDKYHITKKIIKSLQKNNNNFYVNVILGKFNDDEKQIIKMISNDKRFNLVKDSDSLALLMQQSTIGIITFGISIYEAAICSLPLFAISHSNENHNSAKLVEKLGWMSYVGKYNKINYNELIKNVLNLIHNKKELQKMKHACLQIDGLGPKRVAEQIRKL